MRRRRCRVCNNLICGVVCGVCGVDLRARLSSRFQPLPATTAQFVFKGLLYCQACGRKFTAQLSHGTTYYRCGSALTLEPCEMAKHALSETDLLPVITTALGDFLDGTKAGPTINPETAAAAIKKLEAKLTRLKEQYADGDWTRDEFRSATGGS